MNKKIQTKQQRLMQEKRKKTIEDTCGLVCKVDKDVEIYVDPFQYILVVGTSDNSKTYHTTIESVVLEMFDTQNKRLMRASKNKDLNSVIQAHKDLKEWIDKTVMPALKKCSFKSF